ncbi:MAG: PaaI family thioesterase [Deltaproteobacteria bacterium]|nr:PaaI family thioesterase [Deltaproteobacteria bacterium]
MSKKSPLELNDSHPFGELIGLNFTKLEDGYSRCVLEVKKKLLNPYNYLHGGAIYSMADTGMGGALSQLLNQNELCATVEIKISYFVPVTSGTLTCDTRVVHKGKKIATLESEIRQDETLVAKAIGTFLTFNP